MITNKNLKFEGFNPSDLTVSFLNRKISQIHEEAPYDSYLIANFKRNDLVFEGTILINASIGKFSASAMGQNIKEMSYRLVEQIQNQLDNWKSQRFEKNIMA